MYYIRYPQRFSDAQIASADDWPLADRRVRRFVRYWLIIRRVISTPKNAVDNGLDMWQKLFPCNNLQGGYEWMNALINEKEKSYE